MRRLAVAVLLICWLGLSSAVAQSKDAIKKYKNARKEIDKLSLNCTREHPCQTSPPNLPKAEKLLKEALADSPDFLDAQQSLADLYYFQHRFDNAAAEYAKARDIDDKQKKLSKADRDTLLDQLGLAQAQGRHFDDAIQTYTAALREDSQYPLFEYNLACSYAEKGDLDSAIPHLKKAWDLRDNMPSGTPFPDPRKDDSFRKFWNDPEFQKAVENMVV